MKTVQVQANVNSSYQAVVVVLTSETNRTSDNNVVTYPAGFDGHLRSGIEQVCVGIIPTTNILSYTGISLRFRGKVPPVCLIVGRSRNRSDERKRKGVYV